jgi:hypothetical protein
MSGSSSGVWIAKGSVRAWARALAAAGGTGVLGLASPAPAITLFFDDQADWQAAAVLMGLAVFQDFEFTAPNTALANEAAGAPAPGDDLGPVLSFDASNTGLARSFDIRAQQSGAGLVWDDQEFPFDPFSENTLSVGDEDDLEHDVFTISFLDGPVHGFGVVIEDNVPGLSLSDLEIFATFDVIHPDVAFDFDDVVEVLMALGPPFDDIASVLALIGDPANLTLSELLDVAAAIDDLDLVQLLTELVALDPLILLTLDPELIANFPLDLTLDVDDEFFGYLSTDDVRSIAFLEDVASDDIAIRSVHFAVPEPGSALLLGVALAALGRARRGARGYRR